MFLTYFTITGDDIDTMMGVAGDLTGDFLPIILVFVGLSIGFAVYRNFKK